MDTAVNIGSHIFILLKMFLNFKHLCWKCFQDGVCHANVLTYRSERQIGCHSDISDGQLMLSDVR